jgi:hypothetical protein
VTNPASHQKAVYYTSVKIFNVLPKCIANLMDDKKQIVQSSRSPLIEHSFYCIDEFLV